MNNQQKQMLENVNAIIQGAWHDPQKPKNDNDQRPSLSISDPDDKVLVDLLDTMQAHGLSIERPSLLAKIDDYPENVISVGSDVGVAPKYTIPNTRYHPLTTALAEPINQLQTSLDHMANSVYICGSDMQTRAGCIEPYTAEFKTKDEAIVALPGDIVAFKELLDLLNNKQETNNNQPIFVSNFWQPTLDALDYDASLYTNFESISDLTPKLDELKLTEHTHPTPHLNGFKLEPGSTIFMATKTSDKIRDLRKVYAPYGVSVQRLENLCNFNNPAETSGTYSGNVGEKIRSAIQYFDHDYARDADTINQTLARNHIDPSKAYIMSEDSGVSIRNATGIFDHMDTTSFEAGLTLSDAQCPGQETGPGINAKLGDRRFWSSVHTALNALNVTDKQTDNNSVIALTPLMKPTSDAGVPTDRPIHMFASQTEAELLPVPEHGHVTFRELLAPRHPLNPENKSERELGADWMAEHAIKADAARTMMMAGGQYQSTPNNTVSNATPTQKQTMDVCCLTDGLDASDMMDELGHALGSSANITSHSIGEEEIGRPQLSALSTVEDLVHEHDAFVLMPRDKEQDLSFKEIYNFFSLIVSKQLIPRDMDKPFVVINQDDCWKPVLDVYHAMRDNTMIADPEQLFLSEVSTTKDAQTLLEKSKNQTWHTEWDKTETKASPEPKKSNRFNVAVFCSASARNETLNTQAFDMGAWLAKNDCGITFGAGDRGMMGSVWKGALSEKVTKTEQGDSIFFNASSSPDIINVEADDKDKLINSLNNNGEYFGADNIYQRMEYMMKASDTFVIMPGGAGTAQELMALLWLKQEDKPEMRQKDVIVFNPPIDPNRPEKGGFYDELLALVPQEKQAEIGLHVYTDMNKVTEKIEDLRNEEQNKNLIPGVIGSDWDRVRGERQESTQRLH